MGQDLDGLCAILRDAGHAVLSKQLPISPPRLQDLPHAAKEEVMGVYRALGGLQDAPVLRPGSWDLLVDGILVELDEQLHFNRYRAATLDCSSYGRLPRFPLAPYREFCVTKERECLRPGQAQGRWMNASTEKHFGPSSPRGDLSGNGSSRWKQRALYDLMKDLSQLNADFVPAARIAIWDCLPGSDGMSLETALHKPPSRTAATGLRMLICERSGARL
jgi:hypothetical protein